MDNRVTQFQHFENFHIVLWLVKDLSWCMLLKTLGIVMITPTLLLAFTLRGFIVKKNQSCYIIRPLCCGYVPTQYR